MENRIYGVVGIRSIMANWNADFTGRPKSISTGEIFGSDKALKFPIKRFFMSRGEKVLYTKTIKLNESKSDSSIGIKSLKERYEEIFEIDDLKNEKDQTNVIKNLFKAMDVRNFGATFAEEKNNISITGAVQIGQGFNKYEDSNIETQQILSPFRNPKPLPTKNEGNDDSEKERGQATLGSKTVSNEAHYVYPFVVNPKAYDEYKKLGLTDGYNEKDYEILKEGFLVAATSFNTNAKMGCDNELAIFIETEGDLYLPDLAQLVEFEKDADKNIYLLKFDKLINSLDKRIKNVEIYYNPYDTELRHEIKNAKEYNIFTREVLK